MTSQLESMRRRVGRRAVARAGATHVIGVLSGRGGSGVSLLAVTLAIRSAQAGHRTLLVDADPWLDMQRVWLGLPGRRAPRDHPGADPEELVDRVHGHLELLSCGPGEDTDREHRVFTRRLASLYPSRDAVVVDAGTRLESVERCADLSVGSLVLVSACDPIGLASTHAMLKAIGTRMEAPPAIVFNRAGRSGVLAAGAVLKEGAERFLGGAPDVTGGLREDASLEERLAGGATVAESLLGSRLLDDVGALMPRLLPWAPS